MLELLKLFLTFFFIGLFSFGGGASMMSMIEQEVVINNQWLTSAELYQFIGLSESTPGPIAVNIATFIGYSQYGILGSLCATLGVVLPSFIIILIIAKFLNHFASNKYVKMALSGVKAVILGLIFAMGLKIILMNILGDFNYQMEIKFDYKQLVITAIIFVVYFLFVKLFKKKLHPIVIIIFSAVLGILFYI